MLRGLATRAGLAIVATVVIGALAVGLGVPWWIVLVVGAISVGIILFDT